MMKTMKPFNPDLMKNPFVLGIAGVMLLICLAVVAFPKKNNKTENRLEKLESKLSDYEEIRLKTGRIDEQHGSLEEMRAKVGKLETDINMLLEKLEKRSEIRPAKPSAARASEKPPKKADTSKPAPKKAEVSKPAKHPGDKTPHKTGTTKYHKVRSGETLHQIATHYGLSVKDLQKLNHLGTNTKLSTNQQLIVGY
jgi:LysM repeat protein